MYSEDYQHLLQQVPAESLVTKKMRRIKLDGNDATLFAHELNETDLEYYQGHKDTFKRMWQDQGKKFWIRYMISFRWYIVNHGVLSEFPGKKEDFDAIIDQAFIYIHENFIDGKSSQANSLLVDLFVLSLNAGTIKYLESKTISKDPFYNKDTRDVFRRLFGDPSTKISYITVYFTLPLFVLFGGSLIQCLKRWMDAPELLADDESYWQPPQKFASAIPMKPVSQQTEKKKKKKKPQSIPATNNGHVVDTDYKIYLEEKLKGHPFGPQWVSNWEFGDPRFVDEQNPLYDLTADPKSDWREDLNFTSFRDFYDYLKTSDRWDRYFVVFRQYHPDIVIYPPPPHRRVYDEIERSFLDRCEKNYHFGVHIPEEKLPVDNYHTKDAFLIGKWEVSSRLTLLEDHPVPFPCPNVFPQLEPDAKIFVVRKHIDGQGLYETLVPGGILTNEDLLVLSDDLFGSGVDMETSSQNGQREKSSQLVDESQQDCNCNGEQKSSKRGKKAKKPKSAKQKSSSEEDSSKKPESENTKDNLEGKKENSHVEGAAGESVETPGSQDDDSNFCVNYRGPDYPTCLEEMNILSMSDINPEHAILHLTTTSMNNGHLLFDLARRKATLPVPGCRDEFTYGPVTDPIERQMIDSVAHTLSEDWKKAQLRRKEEKEAKKAKKKLRNEKSKKLKELAAPSQESKKPAQSTNTSTSGGLRSCTVCKKVEPNARAYKKCQRCKLEKVKLPRYYCSRDCQVVDWNERHREEHNDNSMETEVD